MTEENMHHILNIQESAMADEEFLRLYRDYQPVNDRFSAFWASLPENQQQIVGDYLSRSTLLYHRLMELAMIYDPQKQPTP